MELLINAVGLLIIDMGAMFYGKYNTKNEILFFIILLLCNIIGGLLYKYRKTFN